MADDRRSLLVVAISPSEFVRFPPLLWRDAFDVNTVDNPRLALKAVERTEFSLILIRYPLPGLDFQRFMDEVRGYGSPCRQSPMAAVVAASGRADAETFIGRGLNRVLVASSSDLELARSLGELLEVAPRTAVRLPIDLTTTVRCRERQLLAQTVNLSASGMLLTDPGGLDVGLEFGFELEVPGTGERIAGRAEVVRCEQRARSTRRCGVRFVSLTDGSREQLDVYLERLDAHE